MNLSTQSFGIKSNNEVELVLGLVGWKRENKLCLIFLNCLLKDLLTINKKEKVKLFAMYNLLQIIIDRFYFLTNDISFKKKKKSSVPGVDLVQFSLLPPKLSYLFCQSFHLFNYIQCIGIMDRSVTEVSLSLAGTQFLKWLSYCTHSRYFPFCSF